MLRSRFGALGWLTCVLCVLGCGNEPPTDPPSETGMLSMSLVTEAGGRTYRLRSATFSISGPVMFDLSSEFDPDAPELTASVPTGGYTVTLQEGWYLERVDPDERVEGVLLSASTVTVEVRPNAIQEVSFLFTIAGEIIEFRGTIRISIDVISQCDALAQTGCNDREACYPTVLPTASVALCERPFQPQPPGSACEYANNCVPGFACDEGTCKALCDVLTDPCECKPLGIANVGVCEP